MATRVSRLSKTNWLLNGVQWPALYAYPRLENWSRSKTFSLVVLTSLSLWTALIVVLFGIN